jgi:hypothetical protein
MVIVFRGKPMTFSISSTMFGWTHSVGSWSKRSEGRPMSAGRWRAVAAGHQRWFAGV